MSTIAALADAVATHVSAGSYGQPVTAVRMYQPAFTLEDLKDLRVSVVPRTVQMTPVTRDSLAIEYVIDVGVQKKLPADGADAAIDELLAFKQGVFDRVVERDAGKHVERVKLSDVRRLLDLTSAAKIVKDRVKSEA